VQRRNRQHACDFRETVELGRNLLAVEVENEQLSRTHFGDEQPIGRGIDALIIETADCRPQRNVGYRREQRVGIRLLRRADCKCDQECRDRQNDDGGKPP